LVLITGAEVFDTVLQGLLYGGSFALAGLGLSMIFSVIGVLNLAHGDFIMLGGFAGLLVTEVISPNTYGVLAIVAIFLIAFALIAALGGAYEFALIRRTLGRGSEGILISSILITVGTALVIENLGSFLIPGYIQGHQSVFSIPLDQAKYTIVLGGGVFVNGISLIALASVAIATVSLYIFSKRTYAGKAMRAVAQNSESARLMGINLQRISILAFALGSGFGAIAGICLGMTISLSPDFGLPYTISLLAVMVLGGTKSYWGPLVGGLVIGFAYEIIGSPMVNPLVLGPFQIQGLEYWAPAAPIIILIVVLMVKPTGLSGRGTTRRA
jgi:branched-subunit amino acid ABC-type transport system permease component